MTNYNTLVLSGGSIKCISILGTLQYCYDNHLLDELHTYIGTSAGSIICYLIAIGYTPIEINVYLCTHDIFKEARYFDFANMIHNGGGMSFASFQDHLERLTIDKIGKLITLNDLKNEFHKKLVITTYNYTMQRTEYLTYENTPDIPCITALRMSSCIPLVFNPFKYMGNLYIDGGFADNFPITYGIDEGISHRLGIIIDFFDDHPQPDPKDENLVVYIFKLLFIQNKHYLDLQLEQVKQYDIIHIKNNTNPLNYTVDKYDKMEMFSNGYSTAKKFFKCQVKCQD